jgi:hypothetical protein
MICHDVMPRNLNSTNGCFLAANGLVLPMDGRPFVQNISLARMNGRRIRIMGAPLRK